MEQIKTVVEWGVIGLLLALSVAAVAVAIERWRFIGRVDVGRYPSRVRLEADLTRRLDWVSTVAANAPYVGLLGTVLGIMLTFERAGALAADWGARLVDGGARGHINAESGLGAWPQGQALMRQLLAPDLEQEQQKEQG